MMMWLFWLDGMVLIICGVISVAVIAMFMISMFCWIDGVFRCVGRLWWVTNRSRRSHQCSIFILNGFY